MAFVPELAVASPLQRQSATIDCPRSMVGRVIGKGGDTIKALQKYTGALIQIDQSVEPTKVTISGTSDSLMLAMSMVIDIVKGTFKGFALLRQLINPVLPAGSGAPLTGRPVYAPGYGLVPPVQVVNTTGTGAPGILASPGSSLDEQLYATVPGLASPHKAVMPMTTMAMVKPPAPSLPTSAQLSVLDGPSTSSALLRPAPTTAFALNGARYPTSAAPAMYGQYPAGMMMDPGLPPTAMHAGLFPGVKPTAGFHHAWPDAATQMGMAAGGVAMASLMAPTSSTIGVNWEPAEAAYYTAAVTN